MKYIPIRFHIFYVIFTLLFSFFGPRVYINYDKAIVLFFMTIYLVIVLLGFFWGFNSKLSHIKKWQPKKNAILKLLKFSIGASLGLYILNILYLIVNGRINLELSSIGANYSGFYNYYSDKTSSSVFTFELIFLVISAIPKYITLALGFIYFSQLSGTYKRLFITVIILIVLSQTLSLGNQKSIGDIAIFGIIALLIRSRDLSGPQRKKLFLGGFSIVIVLFLLLSFTQYSRLASRDITASDFNNYLADYNQVDLAHPIFQIFGYKIGLGVTSFITGYLSGGYYGLSLTLQMPFEWTFGIGNSVALSTLIENIFGADIYSNTYLFRMEKTYGVLGKQHWHTIFPWLASDLTFVGTLLLFFPVSYYYGKCWKEVLTYKNPASLLLFSILSILFIFVPANNQIMHGFDYFLTTMFVIVFWRINHKKYNTTYNT